MPTCTGSSTTKIPATQKEIPGNITVMPSSDMLHKAIEHKHIDVKQYLES